MAMRAGLALGLATGQALAAGPATSPCERWASKLPNVSRALCTTAALKESNAHSVHGMPLSLDQVGIFPGSLGN
jgi:hypothetical protein